jgi:hypothetical protein
VTTLLRSAATTDSAAGRDRLPQLRSGVAAGSGVHDSQVTRTVPARASPTSVPLH